MIFEQIIYQEQLNQDEVFEKTQKLGLETVSSKKNKDKIDHLFEFLKTPEFTVFCKSKNYERVKVVKDYFKVENKLLIKCIEKFSKLKTVKSGLEALNEYLGIVMDSRSSDYCNAKAISIHLVEMINAKEQERVDKFLCSAFEMMKLKFKDARLSVVGSKLKEFLTNYDLQSALNLIIPFTEELIKRYKEIEGKQVVKRLQNLKKYMESLIDEFLLRCVITDTRYDIIKKALNKANKHFDTEQKIF